MEYLDIPPNHERNTLFIHFAHGVQVKVWVTPITHLYYKEQYLPNSKSLFNTEKNKQTNKPKQKYKI